MDLDVYIQKNPSEDKLRKTKVSSKEKENVVNDKLVEKKLGMMSGWTLDRSQSNDEKLKLLKQ